MLSIYSREVASKGWNVCSDYKLLQYSYTDGLVNRHFGGAQMTQCLIDLVDELVLHENGQARKNNYVHIILNNMILLSRLQNIIKIV